MFLLRIIERNSEIRMYRPLGSQQRNWREFQELLFCFKAVILLNNWSLAERKDK